MHVTQRIALIFTLALTVASCGLLESDSEEPNELGGNGNIDLTEPGNDWGIYMNFDDFGPSFQGVQEDITVTARDANGICTFDLKLTFDTTASLALDTLLGTQDLPDDAKRGILDLVLARYGATIDTTDKDNMTLRAVFKAKVTDKGIQEFISSGGNVSKPYTVVKYDASVGDSYEFTAADGMRLKRTVISKSTTDDYQVGFWLLKVIKVKEESVGSEKPLLDELWFITNHKYGLVGLEGTLKNGKQLRMVVFPPTL